MRKLSLIAGVFAAAAVPTLIAAQDHATSKEQLGVSQQHEVPRPSAKGPRRPAPLPGISFGRFHLPVSELGPIDNTVLRTVHPRHLRATVDSVRAAGGRVILAVTRSRVRNPDETFNFNLYKAEIDRWRAAGNLGPAIASGTVLGVYVVDEPNCAPCHGRQAIPWDIVDSMGAYVKRVLGPDVVTIARADPSHFPSPPHFIDVAWAQWEGPRRAKMTPEQFRDKSLADAAAKKMGLIFGLNVLDGGDGSSYISGTYNLQKVSNRWQMSAAEIERIGTIFAMAPACGVVSWRWSPDYPETRSLTPAQLSGIRAFDGRDDVKAAWRKVAAVARQQPMRRCGRP